MHGITYEAAPDADKGALPYPANAPSILGPNYLAVHGQDSITVSVLHTHVFEAPLPLSDFILRVVNF